MPEAAVPPMPLPRRALLALAATLTAPVARASGTGAEAALEHVVDHALAAGDVLLRAEAGQPGEGLGEGHAKCHAICRMSCCGALDA